MPTVHRLAGCKVQIFADDHVPPHFHLVGAGWRCSVDVATLAIMAGRAPRREFEAAMEWARTNRALLLENGASSMSGIEMVVADRALPCLKAVRPVGALTIEVEWASGSRAGRREIVDLSPLIGQFRLYAPLRHDPVLFATVRMAEDGGAVEWRGGEIDMSAESIERLAAEQMTAEDFRAFLARNRLTRQAAAAALGRSLRMIQNYVEGQPIPRVVALACRGYEAERIGMRPERRSA